MGRQVHGVRTGVDEDSLDRIRVPVELAFEEALAGLVEECVCHDLSPNYAGGWVTDESIKC